MHFLTGEGNGTIPLHTEEEFTKRKDEGKRPGYPKPTDEQPICISSPADSTAPHISVRQCCEVKNTDAVSFVVL